MDEAFREGIRLFNTGKFFACHEALEALWLKERGEEKTFLQGLIQVAAAFHHQARGNRQGAQSLLEAGWKKLAPLGENRRDVDLAGLRGQLQPWREFFARDKAHEIASPPQPMIAVTSDEPGREES